MLSSIFKSRIVHLIYLAGLCLICYGPILGGYFLADDFWHVAYAFHVFRGDLGLLWSNFTGNFGGIPGLDFYRPLLGLTFLADFAIWKAEAAGYYLTNLLFYTGCVVLVYWLALTLSKKRSFPAVLAATMFAVYPLHSESVCWISGRSDLASAFFYLITFILFLKSRQTKDMLPGLAAVCTFWLALFSKESAIGLPVVFAAFVCLFPDKNEKQEGRWKSIGNSIVQTLPYWVSALVYMAIRYAALGTFFGGYTGGLGAAFNQWIFQRWLDPNTIYRIFMPFSRDGFSPPIPVAGLLKAGYLLAAVMAVLRFFRTNLSESIKWLILFVVWSFSVTFPLLKIWGIGPNLEGGRLFFFLSVPLCMGLAFMLLSPSVKNGDAEKVSGIDRLAAISGLACLVLVGSIWALSTIHLVKTWRDAGRQVRSLADSCSKLAASRPAGRQFIVIGLPKMLGGAYMILNGTIFRTMLGPPFHNPSIAERFLTFEPYLLGPGETINSARLKQLMEKDTVEGPFVWNATAFEQVSIPAPCDDAQPLIETGFGDRESPKVYRWSTVGSAKSEIRDGNLILKNVDYGDGIRLKGLNLSPLDTDMLKFDIKLARPGSAHLIRARWKGSQVPSPGIGGKNEIGVAFRPPASSFYTAAVDLSHNWRWFLSGRIEEVSLEFFPAEEIEIRNPRFLNVANLKPKITLPGAPIGNNGEYLVNRLPVAVQIDGSMVEGTEVISVTVTKPNFFYDNFLVLKEGSTIASRQFIQNSRGKIVLTEDNFPQDAYYEIRAICRSQQGQIVGVPSDPATIFCKLQHR